MEAAILTVILLLPGFYMLLLIRYAVAWQQIPEIAANELPVAKLLHVHILIPARNEENRILFCLESLKAQDFSRDRMSILVIDDHSADGTAWVVEQFASANPGLQLKLLKLEAGAGSKKKAIEAGLATINSGVVLTTDADCTMGKSWVSGILSYMEMKDLKMLSAPVRFSGSSLFARLQNLEFCGLVAIGGASLKLGAANMCNGANLAYLREAFDEVGGYRGNEDVASGDDEFLFHKMVAKYPGQVDFLKSKDAIVSTPAIKGLRNFVWQRMRWVSKSTKYDNKWITVTLILAYLFNLSILLSLFLPSGLLIFFSILAAKFLAELIFFSVTLPFFSSKKLLWILPLAELPHVIYVLFIGLAGNLLPYQWKGRKH